MTKYLSVIYYFPIYCSYAEDLSVGKEKIRFLLLYTLHFSEDKQALNTQIGKIYNMPTEVHLDWHISAAIYNFHMPMQNLLAWLFERQWVHFKPIWQNARTRSINTDRKKKGELFQCLLVKLHREMIHINNTHSL